MNFMYWLELIRKFTPVLTQAWPHIKALIELFSQVQPPSPSFATAGNQEAAQKGAADISPEREEFVKLAQQAGESEENARKLAAKLS